MTAPVASPARCPYGTGPKRRYRTRREAELAAWRCLARDGRWLRVFHCGCGAWHLTSWPQKARDPEARR